MQQHSVADVMSPQMALQGPCTPSTPSIPGNKCLLFKSQHMLSGRDFSSPDVGGATVGVDGLATYPFLPNNSKNLAVSATRRCPRCVPETLFWMGTSANICKWTYPSLGPMKNTQQRQLNMFDGTSLSGMMFILQAYSFRFSGS
jgi:hypothetical protein